MGAVMKVAKEIGGRRLGAAVVAAGLLLGAQVLRAQAQPQEPAKPDAAAGQAVATNQTIKTESRIVLVDAVVTDKRGHYVTDLGQGDFKVFEDNKEQMISSFSSEANPTAQAAGQKHYMILFFDNSSMETGDRIQAQNAAEKFIESDGGPDRAMAVVNFGGTLIIQQNFTADSKLLTAAVMSNSAPHINSNPQTASGVSAASSQPVMVAMSGLPSLNNAEADFGARSML